MKFLTQPIERESQTSATPKTHTHTQTHTDGTRIGSRDVVVSCSDRGM